jgi:hypothetical protein
MVTPQMDREAFKRQMRAELEILMEGVADAVDDAPSGRIIRDSEEKDRDLFAEFRQKTFEQATQLKIDAAEAASPPSDQSCDTDRLLDEAESTVSQGAKELICRLNQSSASFRKTSENLKRAAQLESNAETICQLVEREGKAVLRALDPRPVGITWHGRPHRIGLLSPLRVRPRCASRRVC